MRDITEVSAFTTPITVPENGDPVAAETRDPALQALANRTKYLDDARVAHDGRIATLEGYDADARLDTLEARFDGFGRVVLPAQVQYSKYLGPGSASPVVSATLIYTGHEWLAGDPGDVVTWDLTPELDRSASIVYVRALVKPGAVPGAGTRITAELLRETYGISFSTPARTSVSVSSQAADTTSNLQWVLIDLSGAPVAVSGGQVWKLLVTASGTAAPAAQDTIVAVEVELLTQLIGVG